MTDNIIQLKFRLIAALAEHTAREPRAYSTDVQKAAAQIAHIAQEIMQLARNFEAGDR